MRHQDTVKKFGRTTNVRKAFVRSLMIALIEHGKITTTEARAKAIRPMIEKLTTKARIDTLANRRLIISRLGGHEIATKQLVENIAPRYKERNGGYTRIVKLPAREGDAAPMAIIEFVD